MGDEDYQYQKLRRSALIHIQGLDRIRLEHLGKYTDLPITDRLFVKDIDSFQKARDVNPVLVAELLKDRYLDSLEEAIQVALEQILDETMHKKDWGGEGNDLYTSNLMVQGQRVPTAFLLKGRGLKKQILEIGDCGKNGDQFVRLMESPARLFVVQFVGDISESIIKDMGGKVQALRAQGKEAWYCIMNGQDTARLLRAYGKI